MDGKQGGGGLPFLSVRFFTVGRHGEDFTLRSTQRRFLV